MDKRVDQFGNWGPAPKGARVTRRTARIPRPRRPPVFRTGPALYRLNVAVVPIEGPGDPPPGFVGGTTSRSEWPIYWAIAKVIGAPKDPRQPPFSGDPGVWSYQKQFLGGRQEAGGAVIDFVVKWGVEFVAMRVQTHHYHVFVSATQQAYDWHQRSHLQKYDRVMDLYEQNFIWDRSGKAAILSVRKALANEPEPNPLMTGQAIRVPSAWEAR